MEASHPMADFFISLSGKDKAWGDWIAWQLKDAGFEVIYQHWHFQAGQNFLLHMEDAGRKAARMLVVLSNITSPASSPFGN
jgi:TIR domain-containing protein